MPLIESSLGARTQKMLQVSEIENNEFPETPESFAPGVNPEDLEEIARTL